LPQQKKKPAERVQQEDPGNELVVIMPRQVGDSGEDKDVQRLRKKVCAELQQKRITRDLGYYHRSAWTGSTLGRKKGKKRRRDVLVRQRLQHKQATDGEEDRRKAKKRGEMRGEKRCEKSREWADSRR
jgi:hypothetical protein